MDLIRLQEEFVRQLLPCLPPGWSSIRIHYENCVLQGIPFEKYIAKATMVDGTARSDINPSLEALDCLIAMKDALPRQEEGLLTWLIFTLDSTGRYRYEFKYDDPPLSSEELKREIAPPGKRPH